jgi:hypothetical protein
MAKTIATILGIGFLLVGVLGFLAPGMLGMHLSTTHNLVHLVTGAVSLYFGLAATLSAARLFDIAFGAVYGLLGVLGFLLGSQGAPHGVPGPPDARLWSVIPGAFEVGTADHVVHILLGLVYLVGGLLTRPVVRTTAD